MLNTPQGLKSSGASSIDAPATYDERLVELVNDECFVIGNEYFHGGIAGSLPRVFLRGELVKRLRQAWRTLPQGYQFYIFDGYRTFRTQAALFDFFVAKVISERGVSEAEAIAVAKDFCSVPAPERRDAIPHLSGGAVDLTLMFEGRPLDMGSAFDEPADISFTAYFDQPFAAISSHLPSGEWSEARWLEVGDNRRLLLKTMLNAGFTNFRNEWWHYDFGNAFWAKQRGVPQIFGSAEHLLEEFYPGEVF